MTPTRKRRLIVVSLVLAAVGVAAGLTALALQQNMTYLFTPSEVNAGKAPPAARFRLGGMVKADSLRRSGDSLRVGKKGKNNGVIIAFSRNLREVYIATGLGT